MTPNTSSTMALQMATLKPGSHVCCFYQSKAEKLAILEPFLRQGLDRGEKVIYVMSGTESLSDVAMCTSEPGKLGKWLSSGQFTLMQARDVYLEKGVFTPEKVIARWQKECERAVDEGYPALRAAAEAEWVLGNTSLEGLSRYESLVQQLFHRFPLSALCQYDLTRFTEPCVIQQLLAHPQVIARNRLARNRLYLPAERFLDESKRLEALRSCGGQSAGFSSLLDTALQPA